MGRPFHPKSNPETRPSQFPWGSGTSLPPSAFRHHWETLTPLLQEWQNSGRIPPVLLLTGQDGIGKRSIAFSLAQWILCEQKQSTLQACEKCPSCLRMTHHQSVDWTEILSESEEDEDSGEGGPLKIDQFRKLKETAGFGLAENQFRVVSIPNADRMTVQASNSVLKILEETPKGWIFILTTNDPALLLPTLISRCQKVRLRPLPIKIIEELLVLAEVASERQKICAQTSQGSWRRALTGSEDDFWYQRKSVFQFLKEPHRILSSLMDWSNEKNSHLEFLIDVLEQLTQDLLQWSALGGRSRPEDFAWTHSDGREEISIHIRNLIRERKTLASARRFWFERAEHLAKIRGKLSAPLNRKLLVQDLLFSWIAS